MKKLLVRLNASWDGVDRRCAAVVLIAFAAGALAGGLFAAYGGETEELAARSLLPSVGPIAPFDGAVTVFRFPLAALLCGLAVFGVIAEPLISASRGFLLCFAATAMFRLYGAQGLLLASAASAVECLFSVPCMLVLGAEGLSASASILACLSGRAKPGAVFTRSYVVRSLLAAVFLTVGSLAEVLLTPILTSAAAALIS